MFGFRGGLARGYISTTRRELGTARCSAKTGPGFTRYRGGTIRETSRACKSRENQVLGRQGKKICERYWSIPSASNRAGYVHDIYITQGSTNFSVYTRKYIKARFELRIRSKLGYLYFYKCIRINEKEKLCMVVIMVIIIIRRMKIFCIKYLRELA